MTDEHVLSKAELLAALRASRDEVLVALLGPKAGLKAADEPVRAAYRRHVAEAHPELAGSPPAAVRGAGPFWSRPSSGPGGERGHPGSTGGEEESSRSDLPWEALSFS